MVPPRPDRRAALAAAAAVGLVALAVAGVAAVARVPLSDDPVTVEAGSTTMVVVALALVAMLLLTAVVLRTALKESGGGPRRRGRRRGSGFAGVLGAVTLVALLSNTAVRDWLRSPLGQQTDPGAGTGGSAATTPERLPTWSWATAGAALALLVLAGVVALWLRRVASGGPTPGVATEPPNGDEEVAGVLRAGAAALALPGEPRAAVIACYAAMEAALAGAGTARGSAETPEELLRRAAAAGVLSGPAASRLTALFVEARFSTHPVHTADRDAAAAALADALTELRS